jgi:DNA invertase Pin-like site-specific DNA recombinase
MTVEFTITPEPAGVWLRVSTGGQDEQNQLPAIEGHCQARGYQIARRYVLNGKSAYHGAQQDQLDQVLADLRAGVIRVLVCWSADRLERRGIEETLRVFRLAREAGGRIESVKEPFLSDPAIGDLLGAIVAWVARFEATRRSDRAAADRATARRTGSFAGRPAWGLKPVRLADGRWTLTATPEGCTYIPEVFTRIGGGQTLRAVAGSMPKA